MGTMVYVPLLLSDCICIVSVCVYIVYMYTDIVYTPLTLNPNEESSWICYTHSIWLVHVRVQ